MSANSAWPTAKLEDIATLEFGASFKSSLFNTEERGLPVVRIRDVNRGFSETYYDGEFDDKYLVNNGDFLIGMDGNFSIAEWSGGKALLNQRVCRIAREVSEEVERKFLYYFLPTPLHIIELKKSFVTVKHLSATDLRSIEVPLPPLAEQRRIAEILDTVNIQIHRTKEASNYLKDELARAFFQQLSRNSQPAQIKTLATVTTGSTPSRKHPEYYGGSIPWVKTNEVSGTAITSTEETITETGLENSNWGCPQMVDT